MTALERWEWTAAALFEYPQDVVMAWQGLTKVLLDGLQERGPAAKPQLDKNRVMFAFGVHGQDEVEALSEARSTLLSILGGDENAVTALRQIKVFDSEKLDLALKNVDKQKHDESSVYSRHDITSLVPPTREYATPAALLNFPTRHPVGGDEQG